LIISDNNVKEESIRTRSERRYITNISTNIPILLTVVTTPRFTKLRSNLLS
jgi:hypothetical protein